MAAPPRNSAFDAFILGVGPAPPPRTKSPPQPPNDIDQEVLLLRSNKSGPDLRVGGCFEAYVIQSSSTAGAEESKQTARHDAGADTPTTREGEGGKERRKSRKDKQCSKACARCRMMKLKCDAGRPCMGCIRKGCASSCVDWDRMRAIGNKVDKAWATSDEGVEWIERPVPWKQAAASLLGAPEDHFMSPEAQQMALEILMACPPREFLTRALGKMLTSSRIADWMHAFSDELLHTFAEYIKMAHAQSAGVQQSFKTTRRVADRFQMLSPDEERGLDIYPGAAYIFYNPQTN
eukprot:3920049-Rhodomonas_salina.1